MGGADNDRLYGGDGNDHLAGQQGADVLFGGTGADIFYFGALSDSTLNEVDIIADFEAQDRIDLSQLHLAYEDLHFNFTADTTDIQIDGSDFDIRLLGQHQLTQDHFHLAQTNLSDKDPIRAALDECRPQGGEDRKSVSDFSASL